MESTTVQCVPEMSDGQEENKVTFDLFIQKIWSVDIIVNKRITIIIICHHIF